MFSLKLNLNYDDDVAKIVSLHIVNRKNGCYDMITLMRLRRGRDDNVIISIQFIKLNL